MCSRGFVFDANNDTIGMKEILDGSDLAEEFAIGDDAKRHAAAPRVSSERAPELQASAGRIGAFLDNELWRARLRGDLTGDVVGCGKIGVGRVGDLLSQGRHTGPVGVFSG